MTLPREPTSAEWDEAERRRALSAHWVGADYEIVDGVLREVAEPRAGADGPRTYLPMATPTILGDFVRLRVGDAPSLLPFARRWGLLGYDALIGRDTASLTSMIGGDPVAWVWAHVLGVQTAVRLWGLWRANDSAGMASFLRKREASLQQWRVLTPVDDLLQRRRFIEAQALVERHLAQRCDEAASDRGVVVLSGDGCHVRSRGYPVSTDGSPGWSGAWNIIRGTINPNLRGVHAQISAFAGRDDLPLVVQGWDSLISVIYRHLFEVFAAGDVEECRECATPFVRTDGRQRFCPPSPGSRESPCAMRFHKREQRKRKSQSSDLKDAEA